METELKGPAEQEPLLTDVLIGFGGDCLAHARFQAGEDRRMQ